MPAYSVERSTSGAIHAYNGRKIMVNKKDPGIAATVYLVHKLGSPSVGQPDNGDLFDIL